MRVTAEAIQKVIDTLEAMEDKRLADSRYYDEVQGCYCVIGVLKPEIKHLPDSGACIKYLVDQGEVSLDDIGIDADFAQWLQEINDLYLGTPEGRYRRVLGWLKDQLDLAKSEEQQGADR